MTRREEIIKATKECREDYVSLGRHLTSDDIADAFEAGVYWADKTMIEKACKWLEERLSDNITYVPETFYGQPKPVISEKGLEDFIKYLEE